MTTGEKIHFLQKEFISLLKSADPSTPPRWGKMNFSQMVEHLSFAIKLAAGKIRVDMPEENESMRKMKAFLMNEKPFRENTKNPFLSEEPYPLKYNTAVAAIQSLQISLIDFFLAYENDPERKEANPVFGYLNFDEQIRLIYKHTTHHLRQFGIIALHKADNSE